MPREIFYFSFPWPDNESHFHTRSFTRNHASSVSLLSCFVVPGSVVHEPSGLEPGSSRAGSSPSSTGVPRARVHSSLLAARAVSSRDESRCELGSSPRVRGCLEPSPLESRSGLDSSRLVNNTSRARESQARQLQKNMAGQII